MLDHYTLHGQGGPVQQVVMDLCHCVEETRTLEGFEMVPRVIPIPKLSRMPGIFDRVLFSRTLAHSERWRDRAAHAFRQSTA